MDRAQFTDRRTGELVRISIPRAAPPAQDWSFIPQVLPPTVDLPGKLHQLWGRALVGVSTLNGIGRTLADPTLLLQPLQTREAVLSSRLEGTYTTEQELLLYAKNPTDPKSESDPANAWREVFNYESTIKMGCEHLKSQPFSLALSRALHQELLRGVRGTDKKPGEFRSEPVCIGATRRFVPPPAAEVPRLLDNLIDYINTESDVDPLIRCYIAHYQIEAIHPFIDGNGRIGRVILALMTFRLLGHQHPWLYMSAFFEKHKDEYVSRLFRVSSEGDWSGWIEFCLQGTVEQAADSIRRCEDLRALYGVYKTRLSKKYRRRTPDILDMLFREPVVNVPYIERTLGVTYKTAKAEIEFLLENDILRPLEGQKRPQSYGAWEVFAAAYRTKDQFAELDEPPAAQPTPGADATKTTESQPGAHQETRFPPDGSDSTRLLE